MSRFVVTIDGHRYEVELSPTLFNQPYDSMPAARQYPAAFSALVNGHPVEVIIPDAGCPAEGMQWLIVNDRPYEVSIDPDMRWIKSRWGVHTLEIRDLDTSVTSLHAGNGRTSNGRIKAPIPGLIIQVLVSTGNLVEAGQPMFILEAMKMENEIRAPRSGIIRTINVSPGQGVALNQVLAEID